MKLKFVNVIVCLSILLGLLGMATPVFSINNDPYMGRQTWQLDSKNLGPNYLMEKNGGPNDGGQSGQIVVPQGASAVWIVDQAACNDVTFSNGNWVVDLFTDTDWGTQADKCIVEVGQWDGSAFKPLDALVYDAFSYLYKDPDSFQQLTILLIIGIQTGPITVNHGNWLSLKITNNDQIDHTIYTGEGYFASYFSSPETDPGYPMTAVSIQKSADEIVKQGGVITYAIQCFNISADESAVENTVVIDTLPAGVMFVSASGVYTYNTTTGTITWNLGSLAYGNIINLEVKARVADDALIGSSIRNQAVITATTGDNYSTDDIAWASTQVVGGTNLILSKSAPWSKAQGTEMTYTLYYQNFGGDPADSVVITDTLPPEVEFVSASEGGNCSGNTVVWNLGTVKAMSNGWVTANVKIGAAIAAGTVITNNAFISTASTEVNYADNNASADTTVTGAVLPLNVAVEPNNGGSTLSVNWGRPITFSFDSCDSATAVQVNVHFTEENYDLDANMTEGPAHHWSHTFDSFYPHHGPVTVTYTVTGCDSPNPFSIYVDPAGYIYDTVTGLRIENASVWLQWPDGFGGWENVPLGKIPPVMDPEKNPLITGADGAYQWLTLEGTYRVFVQASGYYPNISRVVSVPPPVTDLHVGLTPIPTGSQVWYLDQTREMKKTGTKSGHISVAPGSDAVWLSDQKTTTGVTFMEGEWSVNLETANWQGTCTAQVGDSDGNTFTGFGSPVSGIPNAQGIITLKISTGGSVLPNHYLALKITNNGSGSVTTAGDSYLSSPETDPGYPLPELATSILLSVGLLALGGFILIRRRKAACS